MRFTFGNLPNACLVSATTAAILAFGEHRV
jgi:hypothetical protein